MSHIPNWEDAIARMPSLKTALDGSVAWDQIQDFSDIEQDILALLEAVNHITDAASDTEYTDALDHNLRLWVAIRLAVTGENNKLPEEVRNNLRTLANHVIGSTLSAGEGQLDYQKMINLATININVAEGMLKGQLFTLIRERAYHIWEREGRPDGRDKEHWLTAEREIMTAIHDS